MSRRQSLLTRTQSATSCCHPRSSPEPGHTAIWARNSARSSGTRTVWCSSISRCSSRASHSSCGSNADPSRLHITSSALGAIALVGSSWTMKSCRTVSIRSVGRSLVSSWARTAMRRASVRLSSWTGAMPGA